MTMPGASPGYGDVKQALRLIVSDPDYGSSALSSKRAMESLLKDLLPDKPREAAILVAAAEHGLAAVLRERVDLEGMDAGTAIRIVAASFAKSTAFTPDACEWAVTELAIALGMDVPAAPTMPPPADQGAAPTLTGLTAPTPPTDETAPARPIIRAPDPIGYPFTLPEAPARKRRAVWYAVAGVAAVAIAATAIIVLQKNPVPTPVIQVTAASANSTVDGNVYVYYKTKGRAAATITALVSRGTKGEVAELTGQAYPFTATPVVLDSVAITGRQQHLSVQVTPALETRYRVEVLRSAGARRALATSPVRTVYVALIARYKYLRNNCPRPKCFVTIRFRVPVASAAVHVESAKHVYFYWGINLAASGPEPADPTSLTLQKLTTAPATLLGAGVYQVILAFKFTVNQDAYRWHWNICTKADVSADGIGLPGSGECGAATINASPGYLGSLAG